MSKRNVGIENRKISLSVSIHPNNAAALRSEAARLNVSVSEVVDSILTRVNKEAQISVLEPK